MTYMPAALPSLTGVTDIDDSVQDESTGWFVLLTIEPTAPLRSVKVILDLAKATTGFAAVESTATISFAVSRKVDGTNWRRNTPTSALSGTNAAARSIELDVGPVSAAEDVRIEALMSADATGDMEIPYVVYYEGSIAPTVTAVAA